MWADLSLRDVSVAPTIVAAAYASGDIIGTNNPIIISNASRADEKPTKLVRIVVTDKAQQNSVLNLYFFDRKPINSTFTDNGVMLLSDLDLPYYIGHQQVAAGTAFAANSIQLKVVDPPMPFKTVTGRNLWVVVQSGGTPTYASASDLAIEFEFEHNG